MSIEADTPRTLQSSCRQVRIEEVDGDLELFYRRRPTWGTAGCLLVWWTGWTAFTVLLLWKVFADPSVMHALFAFPFVAAWLFVFVLLSWMLLGTERVRLSTEGLEYQTNVFVPWSRRIVPRAELKGVSAGLTVYQVSQDDGPSRSEPCLKFETMGQPLLFAAGIREKEQQGLIERLNAYLDALGPHAVPRPSSILPNTPRGELLRRETIPLEPPSDSRIEVCYDTDTIAFVWKGEWSLSAIAGTTVLHFFWNGIVGLFICQLIQDFQWGLGLFLIPFEAIGLIFAGMWFVALTAPLWRRTWTFGTRAISRRLSISDAEAIVFALGWSKRFRVQPPVRMELHRRERAKQAGSFWSLLSHPDGEYDLAFLDGKSEELLTLKHLTEGDARWIADVLLHSFSSWSHTERPILD